MTFKELKEAIRKHGLRYEYRTEPIRMDIWVQSEVEVVKEWNYESKKLEEVKKVVGKKIGVRKYLLVNTPYKSNTNLWARIDLGAKWIYDGVDEVCSYEREFYVRSIWNAVTGKEVRRDAKWNIENKYFWGN